MRAKKLLTALSCCLLFLSSLSCPLTASAEVTLPPGAVKGLPERLAALDSEGNAVNSATGEYFFRVENMKYAEVYTKSVQLMNLREDYAYHIYFYVEPLYKKGSIDLEKGCECVFRLDGNEFYRGTVTGDGTFDLTQEYYDCGLYYPGDSHVLSCSVVWNDLAVLDDVHVNNGHRLVDKDGTHVLVGPDDSGHVEGEIEFKWIFFAKVNPDDEITDIQTTTTHTGIQTTDTNVTTTHTGKYTTDTKETTTEYDGKFTTVTAVTDTGMIGGTTVDTKPDETTNIHGGQDTTTVLPPSSTTTVTTVIPPGEPGEPGNPKPPGNRPGGFFPPFTGYLAKNGTVWLVGMGAVTVGIIILIVLMLREKRKQKKS
jgi:hypothetical protein